jgi:hypothetical protein
MMRQHMRDDVFGLSRFRQFVDPNRPATPSSAARLPSQRHWLSFASELARASKPYVSPLKRGQTNQPAGSVPNPTARQSTPSASSFFPPNLSKPTTSPKTPPKRLVPPPQPAELTRPATNATPSARMALDAYPHPRGDNGRGMHWVPTMKQSSAVVDRFVAEAQRMGVKWVTFLNDGASVGQNDYLVNKLVGAGIEPIMRLYSAKLAPIHGDIEGMVRHYTKMGVHYFQPFNEPNLSIEQPDGVPSVDRYLQAWIPAAKAIAKGGGLPGFGSLAPGGDKNDIDFLREALDGLRARGELPLLDRAWLSMHNYTHNHPIEERADTDGFFKFRAYHKILQEALGRALPILGTEGGTFVGEHEDKTLAAIDSRTAVEMTQQAYRYMRDQREPWNFAYSFWTIANEAGGGTDTEFSQHALFKGDGTASPIVSAMRALG